MKAESLGFQIGSLKRGQHFKYLPKVFTQEGVAMLSSALRSPRAIQVTRRKIGFHIKEASVPYRVRR